MCANEIVEIKKTDFVDFHLVNFPLPSKNSFKNLSRNFKATNNFDILIIALISAKRQQFVTLIELKCFHKDPRFQPCQKFH